MHARFPAPLALAAIGLLALSAPSFAQGQDAAERRITVNATGEAQAAPDLATVTLGVVTEGVTAATALEGNNQSVSALLARLKEMGLEPRDIQTSGFQVSPRYVYPEQANGGAQEPPSIAGYSVSNTVTARLRDLDGLGEVLDNAVRAGANQIQGIVFEVSKADELADDARRQAFAAARRKAELYAAAAGVTLGPVISISEATHTEPPQPMMRMQAARADSVPVETGEQTLSLTVEVVWGLVD